MVKRCTPLILYGLVTSLYYWSLVNLSFKETKSLGIYRYYLQKNINNLMNLRVFTLPIKSKASFYKLPCLAQDKFWLESILIILNIQKLSSAIISPWFLSCFQKFFVTPNLYSNFKKIDYKKLSDMFKIMVDFIFSEQKTLIKRDKKKILEIGGLHVIGTELNFSRRIDNQLRGRAGRQGELGSSQFFISIEDDTLRNFGKNELERRLLKRQSKINLSCEVPLRIFFQSQLLNSIQRTIESLAFSTRKEFFEYDKFVNFQRIYVYSERFKILRGNAKILHKFFLLINVSQQLNLNEIIRDLYNLTRKKDFKQIRALVCKTLFIGNSSLTYFDLRQTYFGFDWEFHFSQQLVEIKLSEQIAFVLSVTLYEFMIKTIFLDVIDNNWKVQIKIMSDLKESTKWLAYGKMNPIVAYAEQGLNAFSKMLIQIREDVIMKMASTFQNFF